MKEKFEIKQGCESKYARKRGRKEDKMGGWGPFGPL